MSPRWRDLLVAGWLGAALLTAASVTPAAFAVLPTRALAGELVGRVLPVLFIAGALIALVGWWRERSSQASRGRSGLFVVWFLAMVFAQFFVTPRIRELRSAGPIDSLRVDDPRRVTFGRLHGFSVGLLGVGMLASLVVLVAGPKAGRSDAS